MKKISIGGWIVGAIDLLIALFLILMFAVSFQDMDMAYMTDPRTFIPLLCLGAGAFKIIGIIVIWMKKTTGFWLYAFGCVILIFFLARISADLSFANSDEATPLILVYLGIILEIVFIYIMKKAIKDVSPEVSD